MPLNVTGFPLEFDAVINTDNLSAGITSVAENLGKLTDPLKASLAGVDQSLADLLNQIHKLGGDPTIEILFTKYANLQKQQLTLQDTLSKTRDDPAQISELNTQLANTAQQMKEIAVLTGRISGPVEKVVQANREGLRVIHESVRGFIGVFEGVAGAISIFSGNSKEAEQATRAVIGAMGILNGIQGVAALLSKNSAVNFYLQGLAVEALTKSTLKQAAAEKALSIVQAQKGIAPPGTAAVKESAPELPVSIDNSIAAANTLAAQKNTAVVKAANEVEKETKIIKTENNLLTVENTVATDLNAGAKEVESAVTKKTAVAQLELNAAMLSNPVAVILASLVGLFGAYELYIHTLGAATDAEKIKKAQTDALDEANVKAIDSIAKEESSLQSLLIVAKDKNASDIHRQVALNEITAKNPELLGQLTLENVLTERGSELINAQIGLIKQKALAAASEDIYTAALKEQLKAQLELKRLATGGDITIAEALRNTADLLAGNNVGLDPRARAILLLTQDVKELGITTDAAFGNLADQSNKLTDLFQAPDDKIHNLIHTLDLFLDKSKGFNTAIESIFSKPQQLDNTRAPVIPLDPKDFALLKDNELADAKLRVDRAKKGSEEEFAARRALVQKQHDFEVQDNTILYAQKTLDAGKFYSSLEQLGTEQRAKAYKANTDAAEANVIQLEALGKKESDAYFDARVRAIKAAAAEQLNQARSNSDSVQKINEQLNLSLEQNEVDRAKSALQRQRDANAALLNLVKQGSAQELALKIRNIQIESEIELDAIGLTAENKTRILTRAAKEISELNKSFIIQDVKDEENIRIASLETQLATVEQGSIEELQLRKRLVDDKASLEVIGAQESIKNEVLRLAKIAEINAKARADQLKLDNGFFAAELKNKLAAIDKSSAPKIQRLQFTISNPNTSIVDNFNAQKEIIDQQLADLDRKMIAVSQKLIRGQGDAKTLDKELDALEEKSRVLLNQKDVLASQAQLVHLKQVSSEIGKINSAFSSLSGIVKNVDKNFAALVETISQVSSAANIAVNSLAQITKGQLENKNKAGSGFTDVIGGAVGVLGSVFSVVNTINGLFDAAAKKRAELRAEDERTKNNVITGEVAVNDEYRKRLVIQAQINKLKLEGLAAEAEALRLNSQSTIDDFNRVLKEIRDRGKVAIPEGFTAAQLDVIKNLQGIGISNSLTKAFDAATSLAGKSFDELQKLFLEGKLDESATKLFQTLEQLKKEGVDIDKALEENKQKAQEIFTGTTSDAILDSIVQAFADGKKATADFADDFETLMRKSILNSFKFNALEKPIQDFYAKFAAAAKSDNTLSQSEIQDLQKQYNLIITNAGLQFDQLQKLTGPGVNLTGAGASQNGLAGSIKASLTEDTGTVLAGQIGAMRIIGIEQLSTVKNCFSVLNTIANNTERIANVEGYLRKFDTDGIKIK